MPSSGRYDPSRDRSQRSEGSVAGPLAAGESAAAPPAAIEPPQYFDPNEPWDAQSAEALTRLYESGEASLDRQREQERPRSWQPPQGATPPQPQSPSLAQSPPGDTAWLEARLADMAERLQGSLAELNPDKSLAPLNQRLDLIEQRFSEAMARVAQRSDLDALKLIEANVFELVAHVEQTRGRLDRLDAIDDQMRDLARCIEEGDQQRLTALEKLLQDYVAEWRRGDERTVSALHSLEEAVNRIGESVEAVEAHKPVPDLSLYALTTPGLASAAEEYDPLSQAYTEAARALEQRPSRSPLDAADYVPRAEPVMDDRLPPALPRTPTPPPPLPTEDAIPGAAALPSPAFRASEIRAKLRQAQMLRADEEADPARPPPPVPERDAAQSSAPRRAHRGLLLAAALTVFASGGYLLVDALMTTTAHRTPAGIDHGARPAEAKAARTVSDGPASDAAGKAPDTLPRSADQNDKAPAPPQQTGPNKAPADGHTGLVDPAASSTHARVEAIGGAIAAVFRAKEPPAQLQVEPAALPPKDAPAAVDAAPGAAVVALPMTIGPASLRQAAMRGDAAAQFEVAARFASGLGVPRDLQQAVQWYRRAAAQGMALAQYRLGMLQERGWGTPADPERARVWYARAAEQGNVKAMHNLAVLSVSGSRSDYATAAKWFAQAADLGLADSQFNLAVLHQTGLGVPKDLRLAYKWLALAGRGGDSEATSRIAEIKARLAPGQMQEAEAMVASWRPRTPDPAVNELSALSMAP